jgi:hypothetical protein
LVLSHDSRTLRIAAASATVWSWPAICHPTSAFLKRLCHVAAGAGLLWHEIVFQVMPITGNNVK